MARAILTNDDGIGCRAIALSQHLRPDLQVDRE